MNERSAILHQPAPFHLQAPDWGELRKSPPAEAAKSLSAILASLEGIEKQAFALRGMAALLIEERELYRFVIDEEVGDYFQSFDRFLKVSCPTSWSYVRDALRAVKELKDIRFDDLLEIKRCNLEQLKKVSSGVRKLPEVVQAAKTMPEKAFVQKMNAEHQQHLEEKKPIIMAPAGDVDEFEQALAMAMALEECETRADAIKAVAAFYIAENAVQYERLKEKA